MSLKKLTKTFIVISNKKKTYDPHDSNKNNQRGKAQIRELGMQSVND